MICMPPLIALSRDKHFSAPPYSCSLFSASLTTCTVCVGFAVLNFLTECGMITRVRLFPQVDTEKKYWLDATNPSHKFSCTASLLNRHLSRSQKCLSDGNNLLSGVVVVCCFYYKIDVVMFNLN